MTINIKELRRLTQAALAGPDGISLNWIKLLQDFQQKANPAAISEFLDRLEAAEKSDAESIAMYRKARDERDDLRAKIEQMERQEPIGGMLEISPHNYELRWYRPVPFGAKLYALPGAQPAANFADAYQGAMEEVAIWKKRALEAEDLNRKFVDEINGPTCMGEPTQPATTLPDGWKEAAIAWEVCASIHREYGKGKDPFFNTRQGDFVKHANDARAMLAATPEAKRKGEEK